MLIKTPIEKGAIHVRLPLTTPTGKVRVKQRSVLNEYGQPVAPLRTPFSQRSYIEWQVAYDLDITNARATDVTTLHNFTFTGANGKRKSLYELSEYVFHLTRWGVIQAAELTELAAKLRAIPREMLFDAHPDLAIKRSHPVEKEINGVPFLAVRVEYPLMLHKFGDYEIVAEIITREKQHAIGVQPMLFLCFPVTELRTETPLLGRPARSKESADFIVGKNNARVFFKLLHLFGMLGENHRRDILSVIDVVVKNA